MAFQRLSVNLKLNHESLASTVRSCACQFHKVQNYIKFFHVSIALNIRYLMISTFYGNKAYHSCHEFSVDIPNLCLKLRKLMSKIKKGSSKL